MAHYQDNQPTTTTHVNYFSAGSAMIREPAGNATVSYMVGQVVSDGRHTLRITGAPKTTWTGKSGKTEWPCEVVSEG